MVVCSNDTSYLTGLGFECHQRNKEFCTEWRFSPLDLKCQHRRHEPHLSLSTSTCQKLSIPDPGAKCTKIGKKVLAPSWMYNRRFKPVNKWKATYQLSMAFQVYRMREVMPECCWCRNCPTRTTFKVTHHLKYGNTLREWLYKAKCLQFSS